MNALYHSTKSEVKRLAHEITAEKQDIKRSQREFGTADYKALRQLTHQFQVKHIAMSLYRGKTLSAIGNFDADDLRVRQARNILKAIQQVDVEWRKANEAVCVSA